MKYIVIIAYYKDCNAQKTDLQIQFLIQLYISELATKIKYIVHTGSGVSAQVHKVPQIHPLITEQ